MAIAFIRQHPKKIILALLLFSLTVTAIFKHKSALKIIVTQAIDSQLDRIGFKHYSYNISSIGVNSIELNNFDLGESPNLKISHVAVKFNVFDQSLTSVIITKLLLYTHWSPKYNRWQTPLSLPAEENNIGAKPEAPPLKVEDLISSVFFGKWTPWLPQDFKILDSAIFILTDAAPLSKKSTTRAHIPPALFSIPFAKIPFSIQAEPHPEHWSIDLKTSLLSTPLSWTVQPLLSTAHSIQRKTHLSPDPIRLELPGIQIHSHFELKIRRNELEVSSSPLSVKLNGQSSYQNATQKWTLSQFEYQLDQWTLNLPFTSKKKAENFAKINQLKISLKPISHQSQLTNKTISMDLASINLTVAFSDFSSLAKSPDTWDLNGYLSMKNVHMPAKMLNLDTIDIQMAKKAKLMTFKLDGSGLNWNKTISEQIIIAPLDFNVTGTYLAPVVNSKWHIHPTNKESARLTGSFSYNSEKNRGQLKLGTSPSKSWNIQTAIPDLSPLIRSESKMTLAGELGLKAVAPLTQSGLSSLGQLGRLKFHQVDLTREGIEIKGVDAVIELSQFHPSIQSPSFERFFVKYLKVGQTIEDLSFLWRIREPIMDIKRFRAIFLEGKLSINAMSLNWDKKTIKPISINIEHLSLEKVLSLAAKQNLTATGTLNGTIDIKFNSDHTPIVKGLLKTKSHGTIKYDSPQVHQIGKSMNPQMGLILKYLRHLNYKEISMQLSSNEKFQTQMILTILGHSPHLKELGQRPIKLKVKIDLNIYKAIQSYLLAMELPQNLEDRLIDSFAKGVDLESKTQ